jgi:hypothetical protein
VAITEQQRANLLAPVQRHLAPGERVVDVSMGARHEVRRGKDRARVTSVVVTDRRILLFRRKIGGYDLSTLDLRRVIAVDLAVGMVTGELRLISADGDVTRITSVPKDDVERIAAAIRQRLRDEP